MNHPHTRLQLVAATLFFHPLAKAGQVGGNGGDAHRHALERGVSPRLIIGWEYRQVEASEQVIIWHVKDAVVAIEVGRHINHLHLVVGLIPESQIVHLAIDGITALVVDGVGDDGVEEPHCLAAAHSIFQVMASLAGPPGHQHKGHDLATQRAVVTVAKHIHRVEKEVNALVAHLAATTGGHEQRARAQLITAQSTRHTEQSLASRLAGGGIFRAFRHIVLLKGVRGDKGASLQQLLALAGGDIAHGGKHVGLVSSALLKRVFRHHVKLLRHLVAIIAGHVVI